MKTKTMKKALSLFLAVLMIALALPFTLLTVAAEEPAATTVKSVKSTSNGRTTGGVTYALDWAWDGDLTTTYLGTDASKRYAVTDGVFGAGSTYHDYITVELNALSTMTSVTIWGGTDKTSKSFTNDQFDVYYSADGETWTLHSEYSNVCGDGTNAGAGSEGFTEERTAGENTYYGLKLEMNNAVAKYVRIAIKKGRLDRGWAVLREIEVAGTEIAIPVSVAGIQQNANGDVRLVGATDSLNAEGVGFKLDITHTYEEAADAVPASIDSVSLTLKKGTRNDEIPARYGYIGGMIDGDLDITYGANNYDYPYFYSSTTSSYTRTFYYDQDTQKIERDTSGTARTYHGYAVFELSALSTLNSATIWLASDGGDYGAEWSDPTKKWNISDAYDILISEDGETWTLMGEFEDMCGDGTNKGANFPDKGDADYDERVIGRYTRVGHKMDLKGKKAAYVALAIKDGSKNSNNRDIVIGELTVNGTVAADTVTVTKTATYTTDATNVVYNSIIAAGENITAKDINSALYDDNDKLYALGITGIPQSGTVELEVTPYFIPVGTDIKIYGDAATFEIIEGKPLKRNETVKVMSYNLCNGQVNNKTLTQRLDYIAAQINSVDPDVVVLNEARNFDAEHPTYDIAISSLTAKCDVNYGIVEYPDEESKNVVLYNTAKYTLVSSEVIDLPNESQDGTESAAYARTAVFARLKRISDNREFVVSAIHFDYVKSVAKMQAWAVNGHLAENYADVRQIVAGDFNIVGTSSTVHINPFVNEGYVNANTESDATATYPEGAEGENVIDFIYSKDFKASDYTVVNAENASAASDHRAIYAELTLN